MPTDVTQFIIKEIEELNAFQIYYLRRRRKSKYTEAYPEVMTNSAWQKEFNQYKLDKLNSLEE